MFIHEILVDVDALTAAGGGTFNILASLQAKTLRRMGLDPSAAADLSLKVRLVSLDGATEHVAGTAMVPQAKTNGYQWRGSIVVGGGALGAGSYLAEVYVAGDLESSTAARAAAAKRGETMPKTIEAADTARRVRPVRLT